MWSSLLTSASSSRPTARCAKPARDVCVILNACLVVHHGGTSTSSGTATLLRITSMITVCCRTGFRPASSNLSTSPEGVWYLSITSARVTTAAPRGFVTSVTYIVGTHECLAAIPSRPRMVWTCIVTGPTGRSTMSKNWFDKTSPHGGMFSAYLRTPYASHARCFGRTPAMNQNRVALIERGLIGSRGCSATMGYWFSTTAWSTRTFASPAAQRDTHGSHPASRKSRCLHIVMWIPRPCWHMQG